MSKSESVQKRLQKIRPPRVQMTYDVEIGDAIENKELPFVMGVVGDFGGNSEVEKKRLKDRSFVNIDRDNFDEVLKGMAPRLAIKVDNKLQDDGSQLAMELNFNELADFEPQNVVAQVEPLKQLLEARTRLADLRNKLASNDKLEELLDEVVRDTEKLRQISQSTQSDNTGE